MINNNSDACSFYIPYLSFDKKTAHIINNKYIKPIVKLFFDSKGIAKNDYKPLSENNHISDMDFKKTRVSYFYEVILNDIKKYNSGKIYFPIKYIISFDKKCCTYKESYYKNGCEKNIYYNEIKLFEKPILYFIFIDLHDIMEFVRNIEESIK